MTDCLCKHRACVLCNASLFTGLSHELFCKVRGMVSRASYTPKQILFREGDPSTHLYILRSGQVKLTTALDDGREQILRLGVCGHLLGFESMHHDTYDYSVEALTTVETCSIRQKDMLQVISENPAVCRHIARTLTSELEQAEAMIRDLGLKRAAERVASFLLSLVPTHGDVSGNLPLCLKRHDIAELLGITTETVSRVMSRLQREAVIIAPRGSIRILDLDRLRAEAGIHASQASSSKP